MNLYDVYIKTQVHQAQRDKKVSLIALDDTYQKERKKLRTGKLLGKRESYITVMTFGVDNHTTAKAWRSALLLSGFPTIIIQERQDTKVKDLWNNGYFILKIRIPQPKTVFSPSPSNISMKKPVLVPKRHRRKSRNEKKLKAMFTRKQNRKV